MDVLIRTATHPFVPPLLFVAISANKPPSFPPFHIPPARGGVRRRRGREGGSRGVNLEN